MRTRPVVLLLLLAIISGVHADAQEAVLPRGSSRHPATEGGSAYSLHLPPDLGGEKPPLLVVLHEEGFTDQDWVKLLSPLADEGKVALLCPRSIGLGFGTRDTEPLLAAIEQVRTRISAGSVHLMGMRDSGWQVLQLALTRPRAFRTVIALASDVPPVRPASGATSLRLLVMKTKTDRPGVAREAVKRLRENLEFAEFRLLIGDPRSPDPASRQYFLHFVDAASGRGEAGRDLSLPWRTSARGLAERKRPKGTSTWRWRRPTARPTRMPPAARCTAGTIICIPAARCIARPTRGIQPADMFRPTATPIRTATAARRRSKPRRKKWFRAILSRRIRSGAVITTGSLPAAK